MEVEDEVDKCDDEKFMLEVTEVCDDVMYEEELYLPLFGSSRAVPPVNDTELGKLADT